jgi:hypothetical protein
MHIVVPIGSAKPVIERYVVVEFGWAVFSRVEIVYTDDSIWWYPAHNWHEDSGGGDVPRPI